MKIKGMVARHLSYVYNRSYIMIRKIYKIPTCVNTIWRLSKELSLEINNLKLPTVNRHDLKCVLRVYKNSIEVTFVILIALISDHVLGKFSIQYDWN